MLQYQLSGGKHVFLHFDETFVVTTKTGIVKYSAKYHQRRMVMRKERVLVVGAGAMGSMIASNFAAYGYETVLNDISEEQLKKIELIINNDADNLVDAGLYSKEQANNVKELIKYEVDLETASKGADIVIECVFERVDIKQDVFKKLDVYCDEDTLICSNTSSMNIFDIVEVWNPSRLMVAHFFNPGNIMPLVEIVKGPHTSDENVEKVREILVGIGKKTCVLNTYCPGFIVNRLAIATMREIVNMIDKGWVDPMDIDIALGNTDGLRFLYEGPIAKADVVGWDLNKMVAQFILPSLNNETTLPKIVDDLIEDGRLGIKTRKGMLDYSGVDVNDYMNKRAQKIVKMVKFSKELDDAEGL